MLQTKRDIFTSNIDLLVSFEVEDPEDDVPAGAAVLQRLDAGADVGGTLHHEHVLLLGVLRQQSAAANILEYFNFQSHQSTINFADKPFFRKVEFFEILLPASMTVVLTLMM